MGTTADKLNKLLATKAGIKSAIIEKGQPVSDSDTFASYADKIRAIRTSDIQLASIVVTKQPTKTSYTAKESFNPAGMEVKAVFSNAAYKFVTDFTTEPSGALKPTDTKVKVKYTEFGVTAEADVAVTVAAIKLGVPTQSGAPIYTGSAITPAWSGYDSSLMSISGSTSGTNAGSYTAVFSLKDKVNYTWADGTTADKSVAWSIGKAQASITLDKNSVVLNGDKLTETVIINSVGMSSIMVMSSDMSVATVSLDGNVLTISSVNETTGEATIVINGEVDSNYNAPTYPSVAVSAEFIPMATVTITGDSSYDSYGTTQYAATVTVDGTVYHSDAEINVPAGTTITLAVRGNTNQYVNYPAFIYLNGEEIYSGGGAGWGMGEIEYVVQGNVSIQLEKIAAINTYKGEITITETPVTFTINGTEYSAYPSMTWNDWNNSEFNTSGQKVASVTDASGNSVSLDSLIVGGTAYEVGFAPPMATVTLSVVEDYNGGGYAYATVDGTRYVAGYVGEGNYVMLNRGDTEQLVLPIGTVIELQASGSGGAGSRPGIYLNGTKLSSNTYSHTVVGDTLIEMESYYNKEIGPSNRQSWGVIRIIEQ